MIEKINKIITEKFHSVDKLMCGHHVHIIMVDGSEFTFTIHNYTPERVFDTVLDRESVCKL